MHPDASLFDENETKACGDYWLELRHQNLSKVFHICGRIFGSTRLDGLKICKVLEMDQKGPVCMR